MGVIQQEVRQRVDVTEEELRRIYDERQDEFRVPEKIKVREIVVLDSPRAAELAATVVEELRTGISFEEVKGRHGDQLSGVLDIGWVSRGDLDPAIEDGVWELDVEEITEPITARGGLHIAQLVERQETSVQPYEEVEERVYGAEFNRRMMEEYEDYLLELQDQAFFQCRGPLESFCQQKLAGTLATTDSFDDTLGLEDIDRLFAPIAGPEGNQEESEGESDAEDGSGEGR
jgi:parvulin-like peptidyl-prolyl isomerase